MAGAEEIENQEHKPSDETAVSTPESKKFLRILEGQNIYMVFYRLKQQRLKSSFKLSDDVLTRLSAYVREYMEYKHVVGTGFNAFMNGLMKKIQPVSIDLHIKCLSYLHDVDLDYFRDLYSYNKIYQCFRATIANLFVHSTDHRHIGVLIRLLNNNQLVYKNLLPIISRLNSYVTKDIVDKNIVACCSVLDAVVRCCADRFSDILVISLLGYLAKILHSPQNFLFLKEDDAAAVIGAFKTLSRFSFRDFGVKSTSRGLLRECIGKIEEYRNSTVYEEVLVVVYMADVLPHVFDLFIRYGNRSFDFIEPNFLNFNIVKSRRKITDSRDGASGEEIGGEDEPDTRKDRPDANPLVGKNSECDFYKISKENGTKSESESTSTLEKTQFVRLQSRFIEAKYLFLDYLDPFTECFDRVVFYNDLLKIGNAVQLFRNIRMLKKKIDWSDLIVYACNARCKISYIPIILDEYYIKQASHPAYVQIFLNSLKERPEDLIPFTKAAVDQRCDFILMELYLIDIDDRPVIRKMRNIVLKYVIGYEEDKGAGERDKKFITRLKEKVSLEKKDDEERSNIEKMIGSCVDKLTSHTPRKHVAALFLVFISKNTKVPMQMLLYKHMKESLEGGEGCQSIKRTYACLCALILSRNGLEIFDVEDELASIYDGIIALLSYRTSDKRSESYLKKIKESTFGLLFSADEEQLAEVGALSGYGEARLEDSLYFREFSVLDGILNPEAPETER